MNWLARNVPGLNKKHMKRMRRSARKNQKGGWGFDAGLIDVLYPNQYRK